MATAESLSWMGISNVVKEPQTYDFGVSSRLSREALLGFRKIHTAAGDELEVSLSRMFGVDIRVTSVEVSQVRYEAFISTCPTGSYHAVLASESLGGQFQAAFDPQSTSRMLGLVFSTSSNQSDRELSVVDARVLEVRFGDFVKALNSSFKPYFDTKLSLAKSMVNPKQLKIIDDDETVVSVEISFSVGPSKDTVTVHICYPQDVVTPVLVALSDMERATATEALTRDTPIQQSLMGVRLPVAVRLPAWYMDASTVEALQVGDIVRTGIASDADPVLSIAGKPLLSVALFTSRQRVAAEVLDLHTTRKVNQ